MKQSPQQIAMDIKESAQKYGFEIEVRGTVLTISKRIQPGNKEDFCEADMMYYSVLGKLPRTEPGSDWGTDGGSIGGMAALNTGMFKMHRSGGSKRVLAALKKL